MIEVSGVSICALDLEVEYCDENVEEEHGDDDNVHRADGSYSYRGFLEGLKNVIVGRNEIDDVRDSQREA